jgi:phosphoribosylglycinamide formyltransferase-1
MLKVAVFASGNGSNAQRIIEYFSNHAFISIDIILCNKPDAYVMTRAKALGVPALHFSRHSFYQTNEIPDLLLARGIDYIVLAGFLWLIPQNLLNAYPGKIINIHPALLPRFGGKGMFGMKVHETVIASGEQESGITVHYVDDRYDEGAIIFQAKCPVEEGDTPEMLAAKIHVLEHRFFPEVIEKIVTGNS